jgi:hypothetical protein
LQSGARNDLMPFSVVHASQTSSWLASTIVSARMTYSGFLLNT